VIQGSEGERLRFNVDTGLLILEREAEYRAGRISASGLFIFQLETISRNRLGYDGGIKAMHGDPYYNTDWRAFLLTLKEQLGLFDMADIIFAPVRNSTSRSYVEPTPTMSRP
jgi:hypothetical protein